MIAVAWHNFVLREQPLKVRFDFRHDSELRSYLLLGALFELAAQAISLAFALAASQFASDRLPSEYAFAVLAWLVFLVWVFISTRLSPLLPAVAVGNGFTFAETWRATRGNFWRLLWGSLLTILPLAVPMSVLSFYWISPRLGVSGSLPVMIWEASNVAAAFLAGVIELGFLSLAYRHFFEAKAP